MAEEYRIDLLKSNYYKLLHLTLHLYSVRQLSAFAAPKSAMADEGRSSDKLGSREAGLSERERKAALTAGVSERLVPIGIEVECFI